MRIRKSQDRGQGDISWLKSRYSFSFSDYHAPQWQGFGALRVLNEDWISPDSGFGMHPHSDMEIVTIMLSGQLHHKDSMGHEQVLKAGEVQVMTAGRGIVHSEWNASSTEPAHLYQIWIQPQEKGLEPAYEQFLPHLQDGECILASDGPGGLDINQRAEITRLALHRGESFQLLAQDEYSYVQMMSGSGQVAGKTLNSGDALLLHEEEQDFVADEKTELLIIKTGTKK